MLISFQTIKPVVNRIAQFKQPAVHINRSLSIIKPHLIQTINSLAQLAVNYNDLMPVQRADLARTQQLTANWAHFALTPLHALLTHTSPNNLDLSTIYEVNYLFEINTAVLFLILEYTFQDFSKIIPFTLRFIL